MELHNEIRNRINQYVWDRDIRQMSPLNARFLEALRIGYLTIRDLFFDSQLNLWAMSLVYTTLLSLVPLIAVSVSVLKGFGVHQQIEPIMLNFLGPMGERGEEIAHTLINFVESINSRLLGSLGLALLLYTVISLMQKIERAFNFTWHVSQERSFARRFSDYLSVILIGPVLVFSALGLTAQITKSTIYQTLAHTPVLEWFFIAASFILPYLLIILAFTLLYIFIPNTKVRFRSALVGATVAGIIWETVGWLFSAYIANANFTAIYAAFATLFFFMIWLYLSWSILLTGASIAFYVQNPAFRQRDRRALRLSNRMKEKAAILVMSQVAQAYYDQTQPLSLEQLARNLNLTSEPLAPIINTLIRKGLLAKNDADPPRFLPAQAPEMLSVIEIIGAMRTADEDVIMNYGCLPDNDKIDAIIKSHQEASSKVLVPVTLKDLIIQPEKVVDSKQVL